MAQASDDDARAEFAELAAEGILLAGGGRAILLQLAHPAVGHGVARHSDFDAAPLRRLHGTLEFVYAVSSGDERDIRTVQDRVNRAHAPVRGEADPAGSAPGYDARDPRLQLWVAATLYDSAMDVHGRIFGPLDDEVADRLYRDYAHLGTALQMPAELWPPDRAAFAEYWHSSLMGLQVDATTATVAQRLLHSRSLPVFFRMLMPLVRFVTVGLLPPRVRELYGFSWTRAQERRLRALFRVVRPVYRALPRRIRHWPRSHYLGRVRGRGGET